MPIIAIYIIEFILITAASLYIEHLIKLEKIKQYNWKSSQLLKRYEDLARSRCLNLDNEIAAIKRNIEYNNSQYYKYKNDIDALNRKRLDLEDALQSAKQRLSGVQYANQKEAAALEKHLLQQSPTPSPTYGKLLIGSFIAIGVVLSQLLYEMLQTYLAQEAALKDLENDAGACGTTFEWNGFGGDNLPIREEGQCYTTPQAPQRTFTNPLPGQALMTISGIVDDDVLIDGEIYEPGQYPIQNLSWSCSLNQAHSFRYEKIVGPGVSTTVGFNDNWGVSSAISITVSYEPVVN
jgi:hypothetical protein